METRANHIWVGAISLLLITLLGAFIIWIARLGGPGQNEYDIFFRQSVDGLGRGSTVSFAGVPAGQVREIQLWPRDPSYVRVRVQIDENVPILKGTTASLQGSFTGVSNIQLQGAVKGAPPITEKGPEGVPVIPTTRGGLGQLLANAPLLLERLATLTDRLTLVFSDQNQKALAGILSNTEKISGNLADASPQVERTLAELQSTLRQANYTLTSFQKVADSTNSLINQDGSGLADQLREAIKSADGAAKEMQGTLADVRPVTHQLSDSTLPSVEASMQQLRAATRSLQELTDQIRDQGAGGLIHGRKLPDYRK